jgi:L-iditol 2-dehydrogenase
MKAWVQTGIGSFEERDLPVPRAARGEIVVRVRAAVTCGTDLKLLARGHARISLPRTMGHELCGEVVEVGEGVSAVRVGDRVVPGISGPCGQCADCRAGRSNLCGPGQAERSWGAFAEYQRIPAGVVAANLHPKPDGLSDHVAAFLDPLASVLHGWSRLRDPSGTILLYGAGAIALLWTVTARQRGFDVLVVGRQPERLAAAAALGASVLDIQRPSAGVNLSRRRHLADVAVDCTGAGEVWERLPTLVRPGGQVLLFGGCAPQTRVSFDAARLHYDEITLAGSFHYTPDEAREALSLLASGTVDPEPLVTATGSLSELPRFLEAQARGEGIRYAVITE